MIIQKLIIVPNFDIAYSCTLVSQCNVTKLYSHALFIILYLETVIVHVVLNLLLSVYML